MTVFNIHDAKTHFSNLLERVLNGEEVVTAKAGKPVARILPYALDDRSPRVPGIDQGKLIIKPDFDASIPGFDC
jgi:prevent-host-death family protein